MKNIWRVFSHEFITTVTRKSYLIALVLVALGSMAVFFIATSVQDSNLLSGIQGLFIPTFEDGPAGYIDRSGLIEFISDGLKEKMLPYESEDSAMEDLQNGDIIGYYIISADYLETGAVEYVRQEFNPLSSLEESDRFDRLMTENLLKSNLQVAGLYDWPMNLDIRQVYASQGADNAVVEEEITTADTMTAFWIPYVVVYLFYIVLLGSSTLMLNSVSAEKSNRMTEILLTSISPLELLVGKMMGLGLAGMLQTAVWSGTGVFLLQFSERSGLVPDSISLSPWLALWLVIFFVLGYALYGSLMASLGALTASSKEAGQITIIVIFPLLIPMMLINAITTRPNGILTTVLSLIPFTAPVVMPARLSILPVPFWQIGLSCALLVALVAFIIRSAAKLFQAQNLLSSGSVNIPNFLKAVLGLRFKEKED